MFEKFKFFNIKPILSRNAQYNMIIGERSNGKTYGTLEYALTQSIKNHETFAYIRRWEEDFKHNRASTLFTPHEQNNLIRKLTNNVWHGVLYKAHRFYLYKIDIDDKDNEIKVVADEPIGYAFSLSNMEHDKSTSYPTITTIVFDEFLTRGMYLPDEFVVFCNCLSTIIRYRTNVKIFMLGNTVNQYCPYFAEMGLNNILQMSIGDIDVYEYGESDLKVAVQYADGIAKNGKPSDVYFAFNNPKLKMITGGAWELNIYPHCPVKYVPKEILFKYFISFGNDILQCEIIQHDNVVFTFVHRKTTEIKDLEHDLIYSSEYNPQRNYRRKISKPIDDLDRKLYKFYTSEKVFYQSNEIGEIVRNYLLWCNSDNLLK